MDDIERISRWQLATVTIGFLLGTSTLIVHTGPAKQDAWMSVILGGILGMIMMSLWYRLANMFPGELPAQYFPKVAGKYIGTGLSLLYVWFCFHLAALVIRNVVEVYMTTVFVYTPPCVIYAMSSFLSLYALFSGFEPFARTTELVIPVMLLLTAGILLLTAATPDLIKMENFLPMFEKGVVPMLKGAFANFGFPFGETIVLLSTLPHVKRQSESKKYLIWAFVIGTLTLTLIQVRNIAVLGPAQLKGSVFPSLLAVQMINVGQFIQRLDALVLFVWTFGAFKKGTVCLFAVIDNLKVILGIKDKKLLIFPICATTACFSRLLYRNTIDMLDFADYVFPVYAFPFEVIIPSLILVLAVIRKKRS